MKRGEFWLGVVALALSMFSAVAIASTRLAAVEVKVETVSQSLDVVRQDVRELRSISLR